MREEVFMKSLLWFLCGLVYLGFIALCWRVVVFALFVLIVVCGYGCVWGVDMDVCGF